MTDQPDLDAMLTHLEALKEEKDILADQIAMLEADIAHAWPTDQKEVVHGDKVYAVKSDVKKTWDHALAASHLAHVALAERHVDPDSGEIADPADVIAQWFTECAGVSYWRVGKLEAHGIDADKFCDKEYGRRRPVVVRKQEAAPHADHAV